MKIIRVLSLICTIHTVKKGASVVHKTKNILNRNRDEIIEFCKDAVPADFYGLELVTISYGEPQVTKNEQFSLEHTQVDGDNSLKLDMVTCPRMTYTDLETNEEKYFRYVYRLSKATKRHSAFLFRQIFHTGLTFPARLITDIDFSALDRRAGSTVHPFYHELETDTRESEIQSMVNAYQIFRHVNESE